MRTGDYILALIFAILFLPFFLSDDLYQVFVTTSKSHPYFMAFLKFGILATLGETMGYRIKTGDYPTKTFGLMSRAIVWGFLGITIAVAFKIFSQGTPAVLVALGLDNAPASMAGGFSGLKLLTAFSISVAMNVIYAPVMMTTHKVTDTHIDTHKGSLKALLMPIPVGEILGKINWKVQWGFVFKKTIPLFWFPAHTITFLLPAHLQVLFAAVLSIFLGIILSVAAVLNKN
jgi:hypothetical protein